jgi:RNA-splicing ligase RtcB
MNQLFPFNNEELTKAFKAFYDAYANLNNQWIHYQGNNSFGRLYPFHISFDELDIKLWVDECINNIEKEPEDNGTFLVMECHGGAENAGIVTDEEGNNKVFDTLQEAQDEADDCQDGKVIEL